MPLDFLPASHPLNRVRPSLVQAMEAAQASALTRSFASAADLYRAACDRARVDAPVPSAVTHMPLRGFAELTHASLVRLLGEGLRPHDVSLSAVTAIADQVQLVGAFARPDRVVESVRRKVEEVVAGFPRRAEQLECGRNPGDVMDPFLLSATQYLLCGGNLDEGLTAAVVHRCMMMLEDLVGNLHQDTLGAMRGNIRVPEPLGEALDFQQNPFPGADVMRPPLREGEAPKFFQVKNKTGSAKGGDGKRLGDQLALLMGTYGGEAYYVAVLGRTLRGHRSMAGVLQVCPDAVVAVGETALGHLTGSPVGAELLLRVYQQAFRDVAHATGYGVRDVSVAIAAEFRRRLHTPEGELMDGILRDVIRGTPADQDSRYFERPGARGRARGG